MMEENGDDISCKENRGKHELVLVICLSTVWYFSYHPICSHLKTPGNLLQYNWLQNSFCC